MIPRDMTKEDRRFVVPTWVKSAGGYGIPRSERWALVDRIVDSGARVCVIGGAHSAVFAWACGDDRVLHYVYTPRELRGRGLARRAVEALFGRYPDVIHMTHPWPRDSARFRYAPHLLLRAAA